MPLHSHADRDGIKARAEADFLNLYLEHGGQRRGKALHCLFHKDRNPSATIHEGRLRRVRAVRVPALGQWIERKTAPAEVK